MEITEYLPVDFRTQMEAETLCGAEEIRLRVGQPLEILYAEEKEKEIGLLTEAHMREVLNYLSGYSVYALEEELRQGYFTLEGGHRIGVSGRASYEKHGTSSCMKLLSCISGLNIRLAHEKKGCASVLIPWLYCGENVYHTFFFAPPGVGKTTYLRDCIRLLSKGNHLRAGKKFLHRFGHDVRKIVPGKLQRVLLVLRRHQRERYVLVERARQIAQLAVHSRRDRRLGQPRPDRRRHIRRASAVRHLAHGTVGQGDAEMGGHLGFLR